MINSLNDSVLRKAAERRGYILQKSRSKQGIDNYGGYRIIDFNNAIVVGEKFNLTPEDVRDWLNEE